ncbi:hypothetical protein [Paenibacillus aceti]|uniref:Uncharacterized protein n=1 Tax=Paenibacillus aceti TaxID=1820010 RepID=A0ABQ1VQW9_9BACL|nr:hypothetical protein [Paenibacillus aceti]GGF86704.1 hypothetical protein GCM10010913_05270 [Paenibacillus aceti]
MTKQKLIEKYTELLRLHMEKYEEARRLKHATTDPDLKGAYELEQENHAVHKHAIEDFLQDLRRLDLQGSLYESSFRGG